MKTHTDEYTQQETNKKRKPIELYRFWRDGGVAWYYTSADFSIVYNANTYDPATIGRGPSRYDAEFEISSMRISFGYLNSPVVEYIAQNPVELIWVEVLRWYEATPTEPSVIFVGQVKNVSFEGNNANVSCAGFEHYLKQRIPKYRYQIGCNNDLFDSYCGINRASWLTSTTITAVDADGVVLTSADFGAQDDGYFTRGFLDWGDYHRMIVHHVGNDITIRFRMPGFTSGQTVDAYTGCDRQLTTCVEKFDNKDNFFGHPWIPIDNPSQWIM